MINRLLVCIFICLLTCSIAFSQGTNKRIEGGEDWLKLNDREKYIYLEGYQNGMITLLAKGMISLADCECVKGDPSAGRLATTHTNISVGNFDIKVVAKVITDLCKDPANVYISNVTMIGVAISKLKGNNVEGEIIRLRKVAAYELRNKQ